MINQPSLFPAEEKIKSAEAKEKKNLYNKAYKEKNKEKMKAGQKAWGIKNKERRRLTEIKRLYGISKEDYDKLFSAQNGRCAICGKLDWNGKNPFIDHNHITGKIRGILCTNCNHALGHMKDDPEILAKAIEYLKRNS